MSGFSKDQFEAIMNKLNELLAKNNELEKAIAIKDDELALQKEQIAFLTQKLYGRKKESLDFDPNQVNLFDDQLFIEPEHTGDQSDEVIIIKAYGRKKRKGLKQAQSSTDGRSYTRNRSLLLSKLSRSHERDFYNTGTTRSEVYSRSNGESSSLSKNICLL